MATQLNIVDILYSKKPRSNRLHSICAMAKPGQMLILGTWSCQKCGGIVEIERYRPPKWFASPVDPKCEEAIRQSGEIPF